MQFNVKEFVELVDSCTGCLEYIKSGEFPQEPDHVLDDMIVDLNLCLTCLEESSVIIGDILKELVAKREAL